MQVYKHISQIAYANSQYPPSLREIASPPPILNVIGQLENLPLVAIVGSRRPTAYGNECTYLLARELASAGVGIISGLAIGIDAIAHKAALEAGGYTIAVLGNGLDQIYPTRNRSLALQIIKNGGALISEQPIGMPALKHHFPARNRIIAGLALATIVTEADVSSGSLITANFAREENRLVMAVPGSITSLRSSGPNNLIRAGAIPVTSSQDVLDMLNLPSRPIALTVASSTQEALILEQLEGRSMSSEELIRQCNLDAATFARTISLMEISGKVRSLGAGVWIRR